MASTDSNMQDGVCQEAIAATRKHEGEVCTLKCDDSVRVFKTFDEMPLHALLLRGVYSAGFECPSPIQQRAIGAMIAGGDVIAQAQSGTGKTGAFSIGLLQRIDPRRRVTQGMVLSPTRELAEQNAEVLAQLGEFVGREGSHRLVALFVGSTPRNVDVQVLRDGVTVAVGTPGRIADLMRRGALQVGNMKTIVLDEADEMLSQGFADQVTDIFRFMPRDVQIGLFSATMPDDVLTICQRFMRNPTRILVPVEEQSLRGIKQFHVALADDEEKMMAVMDLFESVSIAQSVIFSNKKSRVEWIASRLMADNHTVSVLHAAMETKDRNAVMRKFKRGESRVLVTTDLVARGIDVQHVNYVINFDVPMNVECYLHRIGRSGRFGRRGIAINFVSPPEAAALQQLEMHYHVHIPELPEDFARYLDDDV